MTLEQGLLFGLLAVLFGLFIWGRIRYDLVALAALVAAVVLGVVDADAAFSGFGHPAVILVAMVLVISQGLIRTGAIDAIARRIASAAASPARHIAIIGTLGAALSAFMNNIAALAILMPVDLQAAARAKRSAATSLMPLSFATILGGMVTLIGTPPNIIVAEYRASAVGTPFLMFDFTPVGLICAVAGVAFVALVGWRLLPAERLKQDASAELRAIHGFVAEVVVDAESPIVGKKVSDLDDDAEKSEVTIIGLVRNGRRLPGGARRAEIRAGDLLVVDASAGAIDGFVGALRLKFVGEDKHREEAGDDLALREVVVMPDSRIEGRSADTARLLTYWGVTLLGVSRRGKRFRERVRSIPLQAGDVLLLLGPAERIDDVAGRLGTLPLAAGEADVTRYGRAAPAVAIFAAAIALASFGLVALPVALAAVIVLYAATDILPPRQLYEAIDWPIIVLLGALIPIGGALHATGGTVLIADGLLMVAGGLPAAAVLVVLMVVVMTLSDILNNAATAVLAAPIAVEIAVRLDVSPDPFLMAVAIGASCAFLTPIGHQNNTLILGPGGYTFGDYWRMGLPLEAIIVLVGTPAILFFWPL
jgi:di/tricarboxylate transporter